MSSEATRERIAELERQLAEAVAAAQTDDRGSAESTEALERIAELSAELGQLLQPPERAEAFGGVAAETGSVAPRRRFPVQVAILVIVVGGFIGWGAISAMNANRAGDTDSAVNSDTSVAVTTVPRGGQLRVGASLGQKRTIDCNSGNLTLYGTGIFSVTGHCTSLTTGATRSQVSVENADVVNITGYDSEYFIAGHGASLTVTNNGNTVHMDGIDAVNFAGDDNTVIHKSGSPQVADTGQGNLVTDKK